MTLSALDKSLSTARAFSHTAHSVSLQMKQAGSLSSQIASDGFSGMGQFSNYAEKRTQNRNYGQFRGWLYSAINAIASEGAGQSARVGRLLEQGGVSDSSDSAEERRAVFNSSKDYSDFLRSKMSKGAINSTTVATNKSSRMGVELVTSGEIIDLLERPNSIQNRWQFTYSFIVNLCLTGWSYIITDTVNGRKEMYSIPTTWVTPNHDGGPFSSFTIANPKKPGEQGTKLPREAVAFAHLPDPSDPLSAMAPATAQAISVRIDDYIQTSQEAFFNNGIFPSVLVTVGKMPLGETGGVRPRLSGNQRRQVHAAIRKAMGSIQNYGNPGILDGLIERIDRLSATQNEMGWEKSEKTTRLRILSSFAVHPFILGEEMAGSYAQAYTVLERFCNRVNTYLDLLGLVLTNFFAQDQELLEKDRIVWWEPCEPKDPEQVRRWWDTAARQNWVSQNEFRTKLGLPPDEDSNQQYLDRAMATEVNRLLQQMGQGLVNPQQAGAFLRAIGLPEKIVSDMVAMTEIEPEPSTEPVTPAASETSETGDSAGNSDAVQEAVGEIRATLEHLKTLQPARLVDLAYLNTL